MCCGPGEVWTVTLVWTTCFLDFDLSPSPVCIRLGNLHCKRTMLSVNKQSCSLTTLTPHARCQPLRAIKLYTNPGSRGKIAEWVLAEMKLPYETVLLDMKKQEHKAPAYLAINPWGKVPAMEDGQSCCAPEGTVVLWMGSWCRMMHPHECVLPPVPRCHAHCPDCCLPRWPEAV